MNRDKIGTQTCYIYQFANKGMLMYIACLCPNLVSVHFNAVPILHFKFHKFLFTCNIFLEKPSIAPCMTILQRMSLGCESVCHT